ncbi:ATP-binding protein [Nannocystis pusilla]|uniref:ATP-binding protein n=1 Tax=Nannocystis pusilla TaxID=889268 RepID=UPI003B81CF8C
MDRGGARRQARRGVAAAHAPAAQARPPARDADRRDPPLLARRPRPRRRGRRRHGSAAGRGGRTAEPAVLRTDHDRPRHADADHRARPAPAGVPEPAQQRPQARAPRRCPHRSRVARRRSTVRISFRDDGPGIAPGFHERIWGLFQTLESRDKFEGAGIGLSVVKKIVESRGGSVALESQPGAGATFLVRWPKRSG